jgi:NAD(P)-dependent dehydrogenase (short-subunit alcohol dehydrogenase family)
MNPSRTPVALVTGANKGGGFEAARAIAKAGYARRRGSGANVPAQQNRRK